MTTVIYVKGRDKFPDRTKLVGIAEYARRRRWNLQTMEAIKSVSQLKSAIELWTPSGFIVNRGGGLNGIPVSSFLGIPTVLFHFPTTARDARLPCVCNDARQTAILAARTLLSLNLENYGYVSWYEPLSWSETRRKAFAEMLALHGQRLHVFSCDTSNQTSTTRGLITWLQQIPKPLGLFAANDTVASLVADACKLSGLSIPEDVSVIGVDNDIEVCEANTPTLSSIELNHTLSGRLAAEMLDQLMQKRSRKIQSVTYPPLGVVNRESTRRFPKTDKAISLVVERIRKEACNGLTARDVLNELPWSRRVAEVRFKALTGHTILDEIRSVRLTAAKDLLRDGKSSLEAIAHRSGYATLPAFSAFFKAETGFAPSVWKSRKAHNQT